MIKCKIQCELDMEGEFICCNYCSFSDVCGSPCEENHINCGNKLEFKEDTK